MSSPISFGVGAHTQQAYVTGNLFFLESFGLYELLLVIAFTVSLARRFLFLPRVPHPMLFFSGLLSALLSGDLRDLYVSGKVACRGYE